MSDVTNVNQRGVDMNLYCPGTLSYKDDHISIFELVIFSGDLNILPLTLRCSRDPSFR